MADLETFRREVAAWIAANYPPSLRAPMTLEGDETPWGGRRATYKNPDIKLWLDRVAAKGWTVPTWPKDYGGAGLSAAEASVLAEEFNRAKCRRALYSFGINMLGPVLLEFGSEEQRRTHLPKIARGEIRWCQGYSEPGAGSDLAALKTRADDKGDHWLVNGQKIWTSFAHLSDWIFCLVRTDSSTKHGGISFLLIDMETPGVKTRPIKLIAGLSHFCETFFTDVKVPKENLVGAPGQGWTIAKRLLQYERTNIAMNDQSGLGGTPTGVPLPDLAKDYVGACNGRIADPVMRDSVAHHEMNTHAFALTLKRAAEEAAAGGGVSAASSLLKFCGAELNKRKYELMLEIMGEAALGEPGTGATRDEQEVPYQWLRSKANSIEGGTNEIQLNIVAKRVLGLPD